MDATPADRVREQMGAAYVNNAGLIRWIDGEDVPEGYYEYALNNDDYNFTTIEDMVETMDLCCWKIGTPDDQTGYVEVLVGEYSFFLNLRTNQLLSHDKQYEVGEKNNATPIYERQCRVTLWVRDDWGTLW